MANESTMEASAPAIGIDLGTSYTRVAVYQHDQVTIIPNEQGSFHTPSLVAFTDTAQLIGDSARCQAASNPANTIFNIKRMLGREYIDAFVQADLVGLPFTIVNKQGKPGIAVRYQGDVETLLPEQISARILVEMKERAEKYLGCTVSDAVVTVPAYFNDAQRQATRDAGTLAGMNILRTVSEPTAAAVACYAPKNNKDKRNVLVLDLGGGTFDVTMLEIEDGIFQVRSTAGDSCLGGVDFDNRLVAHFVRDFGVRHSKDLTASAHAICRLRSACEQAKCDLSSSELASVKIDALFEGIDFCATITRAQFEYLCEDLYSAIQRPIESALRHARTEKSSIHDIVMLGGSSRMPKIRKTVSDFFNGRELTSPLRSDEAVVVGAATHAALLDNHTAPHFEKNPWIALDVTPFSIGLETAGGIMTPVIECNTSIPTKKSYTVSTSTDNQSSVQVKVFEGERVQTKYNNLLGEVIITGIPPAPRGSHRIVVTFDLDPNGIINVTALNHSTGKTEKIVTTNDKIKLRG